jgi:hypothetical protein
VVVADVLQRGCDTFNEVVVANGRHGRGLCEAVKRGEKTDIVPRSAAKWRVTGAGMCRMW